MVIGIDASRANRPHKTGTEWYAYYLIRWLAKLDKSNQYILYTDKPLTGGLLDLTTKQYYGSGYEEDANNARYDNKGFQIIKSPFNNFKAKILKWPFKFLWTQGRLSLEMMFKRIETLFVPAHALPFIHPKKSIITIHDVGFERDRLMYRYEKMGPASAPGHKFLNILVRMISLNKYGANTLDYLSWSTRFGLKYSKKIICVSNFTKQDVEELYHADSNKIKVIYNGYNRLLYRKIKDKEKVDFILEKYGIPKPYLLYIGRLEKKKNTPALVEAFANFKEKNKGKKHKLVLVGDAGYGYDEVKYAIREFNLDNEVITPGWVDEIDMPYIYNGATAFVFPSRYEGFGIPLIQAMACEVPVIASWASSIPEIAGEAALLFNPNDINSIAQAIEKVINDETLRLKLKEKGNHHVKQYSWEKSAEETLLEIKNM